MRKTVIALLLALCFIMPAKGAEAEPIRVAFIDTGISVKHLAPEQVMSGKNYVFPENDTQDRLGHGTATAGMVLGSKALGILGTCENAVAVPLVCYDLYPSGVPKNGGTGAICAAVYDAVNIYNCRVINMSLGVAAPSDELLAAVTYAEERGAVVVSAVGNDYVTAAERQYYPACYETVIGVGAADGKKAADFSQRNGVSVLAPGVNLSAVSNRNAEECAVLSGSSYACATVSGLCAAILSENPMLTPPQVRQLLYASAKDVDAWGFDSASGWGLVGQQDPGLEISRGEFLTALYRYNCYKLGEEPGLGMDAIEWAIAEKISDGENLQAELPREQLVTMLYRKAKEPPGVADMSSFKDATKVSGFAENAIAWAVQEGIIKGDNGNLNPRTAATCHMAEAILRRYAHAQRGD